MILTTRPVARGHQLDMSPQQAAAIRYAITNYDGQLGRGTGPGHLTSTQLTALAKRGWVTLTYHTGGRRRIITGATVTTSGANRAIELTAEIYVGAHREMEDHGYRTDHRRR